MKNNSIGIFDSGVGGLSIWREIVALLPNESTLYVADQINCPYGVKTSEEVYELSRRIVSWLLTQKVKLIVLACNTITVSSLEKLRNDFPEIPIIGTVPVIKTAAEISKTKKIGVLSTSRTSQSNYQKHLMNKFASNVSVINVGTDILVPFIEKGDIHSSELHQVLQKELQPFKDASIDTLALGCTHFPFLRKEIQSILGNSVTILDSGSAIARQGERILTQRKEKAEHEKGSHILYTTGNKEMFSKTIQTLLDKALWSTIQEIHELKI